MFINLYSSGQFSDFSVNSSAKEKNQPEPGKTQKNIFSITAFFIPGPSKNRYIPAIIACLVFGLFSCSVDVPADKEGYPCNPYESCGEGLVCINNICVKDPCSHLSCEDDEACIFGDCFPLNCQWDCKEGEVCWNGECTDISCVNVECPQDEVCKDGDCIPDNINDLDECIPACGTGEICNNGECFEGCLIDGDLFHDEELNPENDCLACRAQASNLEWTPLPRGTECGDTWECDGSGLCLPVECEEQCSDFNGWHPTEDDAYLCCDDIDLCTCKDEEYRNYECVENECEYSVTDTRISYSMCESCNDNNPCTGNDCQEGACISDNRESGYPCGTAGECDGQGQCTQGCVIENEDFGFGDLNPENECEYCNPEISMNAWSPRDGVSCETSNDCSLGICDEGICAEEMICAGTTYECGCSTCIDCSALDDWVDEGNSYYACEEGTNHRCTAQDENYLEHFCQEMICEASVSSIRTRLSNCQECDDGNDCTYASCQDGNCVFSPASAGTACGISGQCDDLGNCSEGCEINGAIYPDGALNPDNPCEICSVVYSQSEWKNRSAGTICGDGRVCDEEGVCTERCELPWGGTIGHGESVTAFEEELPACGNTCISESRNCNYGILSGSYDKESCTERIIPGPVVVADSGDECDGEITLTASGGSEGTIYWQGTTSGGTSTSNPITSKTVTSSGTYYFRAKSPDECWGPEGSSTVTVYVEPELVSVSGGGSQCGGTMTLTASGGENGTIYWQGTTSGGTSTLNPSSSETVSSSGTYYFRAVSGTNCWGPEGSATVTINKEDDCLECTSDDDCSSFCLSRAGTCDNDGFCEFSYHSEGNPCRSYNQVPNMDGPFSPSGEVFASSFYSSSYVPHNAFDGHNVNRWLSSHDFSGGHATGDVWIGYSWGAPDFPIQREITHYSIEVGNYGLHDRNIRSWFFQGSNDGNLWNNLHSVSDHFANVERGVNWFRVESPGLYSMYRLLITENYGSPIIGINQIQLSSFDIPSLVPVMTSNSLPEGLVTVSSFFGDLNTHNGWRAFDRTGHHWVSKSRQWPSTYPEGEWISYTWPDGEEHTITHYAIYWANAGNEGRAPKSWLFMAFDEEEDDFIILHSVENEQAWKSMEIREYALSTPARYQHYRLFFTDIQNPAASVVSIGNIFMYSKQPLACDENNLSCYVEPECHLITSDGLNVAPDGTECADYAGECQGGMCIIN